MKTLIQNLSFIIISFLCFSITIETKAQQTKKISLQGFLKDANGKAVADGQQEITFKLYTALTGGTAEWTDVQTLNVFGGVYSTHLGKTTNPLDALNWGVNTYYVGVTVQGTELTPRTELTFAPYSLGSPKAQEVVCSGAVGDVKYSILDPTQFAAVNGSCWVPMDGRALIATDKLRTITGLTTLPNAGGLFLRGQEFAGQPSNHDPDRTATTTIATLQDQAFLSHNHTGSTSTDGGGYIGTFVTPGYITVSGNQLVGGSNGLNQLPNTSAYAPSHSHSLNINANGGTETRPKNLNLWTYIRIN
jgi:hypothetical protein